MELYFSKLSSLIKGIYLLHHKKKSIQLASNALFLFVTSSGETSNFLMEDLERVLQLETLNRTTL
jgi:hypothetical protein